ncbi:MAG: hypothetical protein WAS51_14645 [Ilumatobacteraceae bacterium]
MKWIYGEKIDNCPECDKQLDQAEYDQQFCRSCDANRQKFRFVGSEPGFCRTMYRGTRDRVLYALTSESDGLKFYQCTNDGEPSWEVRMPSAARFDRLVDPRRREDQ